MNRHQQKKNNETSSTLSQPSVSPTPIRIHVEPIAIATAATPAKPNSLTSTIAGTIRKWLKTDKTKKNTSPERRNVPLASLPDSAIAGESDSKLLIPFKKNTSLEVKSVPFVSLADLASAGESDIRTPVPVKKLQKGGSYAVIPDKDLVKVSSQEKRKNRNSVAKLITLYGMSTDDQILEELRKEEAEAKANTRGNISSSVSDVTSSTLQTFTDPAKREARHTRSSTTIPRPVPGIMDVVPPESTVNPASSLVSPRIDTPECFSSTPSPMSASLLPGAVPSPPVRAVMSPTVISEGGGDEEFHPINPSNTHNREKKLISYTAPAGNLPTPNSSLSQAKKSALNKKEDKVGKIENSPPKGRFPEIPSGKRREQIASGNNVMSLATRGVNENNAIEVSQAKLLARNYVDISTYTPRQSHRTKAPSKLEPLNNGAFSSSNSFMASLT